MCWLRNLRKNTGSVCLLLNFSFSKARFIKEPTFQDKKENKGDNPAKVFTHNPSTMALVIATLIVLLPSKGPQYPELADIK